MSRKVLHIVCSILVLSLLLGAPLPAAWAASPQTSSPLAQGEGLPPIYNWEGHSNQLEAHFGWRTVAAGDVNGDGYADALVSAPDYDGLATNGGRAYLYYGSAGGLSAVPAWYADGDQADARFGNNLAGIGDVNGDGYDDVAISALYYDDGEADEGVVFVWYGSAGGLPCGAGCPVSAASAPWKAQSNQASALLSGLTGGDINGDGYSDLIASATAYDYVANADAGAVFAWYGGPDTLGGLNGGAPGLPTNAGWAVYGDQANGKIGYRLAAADVNGSGHADVIVGTIAYEHGQSGEGALFAWYGPLSGQTSPANANWKAESNQADARLGLKTASAGDVNGDGYTDLVASAPYYDNGQDGEGMAFVFHGSASGLSGGAGDWQDAYAAADWKVESNQVGVYLGFAVGAAGDVNSDGYADVIIGDHLYDTSANNDRGKVFVFYGAAGGLPCGAGCPVGAAAANWSVAGDQDGAQLGYFAAGLGDVNDDGYDDVIVGAPMYDTASSDGGQAFAYYGGHDNLPASYDWEGHSNQLEAHFGWRTAAAGDVNGDGYADALVSAPDYDGLATNGGRAYLYYGSASGLSALPAWYADGDQADARFGLRLAGIGDVNGDGYDDIAISATYYDDGETDEGVIFVWYGSAGGLPCGAGCPVSAASAPWKAQSDQADARLSSLSGGDINGDGYSDLIAGASLYDNGPAADAGAVFAWYGGPDMLGGLNGGAPGLPTNAGWTAYGSQANDKLGSAVAAVDVQADGQADVIAGARDYNNGSSLEGAVFAWYAPLSGQTSPANANWKVESNQESGLLGYAVGPAGDVNGDGYPDLIVSALTYGHGQNGEGLAFVFHGSASGLSGGTSDWQDVYNAADWKVESNDQDAQLGGTVGVAGDVNSDGYDDVIVGAHGYTHGESDEGMAFVFYGSASGLPGAPGAVDAFDAANWKAEANQAGAAFGFAVAGLGDVNGDAASDVIVGAYLYDTASSDGGQVFAYYGDHSPTAVALRTLAASGYRAWAAWLLVAVIGLGLVGLAVARRRRLV